MSKAPIVRRLLQRACTVGVLQANQIGMTVHALRQLDLLSLHNAALLETVRANMTDADARSQANMLHCIACSTREQFDVHVGLPTAVVDILRSVQHELAEMVDDLTAPESVLAMEAVIHLSPFGPGCVDLTLNEELQERCMALVKVVERPVELIGIAKMVVEVLQQQQQQDSASGNKGLPEQTHRWVEPVLAGLLEVLDARLEVFSKQDLISLIDALTLRTDVGESTSSARRLSSSTGSSAPPLVGSRILLDGCRPLVFRVLSRAEALTDSFSSAQCSAWAVRLVQLDLHQSHPLFLRVVQRVEDAPASQRDITISQLATTAESVAFALTASGTDVTAKVLSPDATVDLALLTAATKFTATDTDGCVNIFCSLFTRTVVFAETVCRDKSTNVETHQETRAHVWRLLHCLPEQALVSYAYRGLTSPQQQVEHSRTEQLRIFSASLERASSLLLRNFAELHPREQADVARVALHWGVFACHGGNNAMSSGGSTNSTSSSSSNIGGADVAAAKALLFHSSLSDADANRKLRALCGLVCSSLPNFNAIDAVQILNELAALYFMDQKETLSAAPHDAGDSTATTTATVKETCMQLHTLLQSYGEHGLQSMHTAHLARYMTSMSKLGVRVKASYYVVLKVLETRDMSPFERIAVLGVLARHHLQRPYFIIGAVQRLGEFAEVLQPSQKGLTLKYLGQVNAQRFVKAPLMPTLDAGTFFRDKAELSQLNYLEAVFCFNGLMALRQYGSGLIPWLIDEGGTLSLSPNTDAPGLKGTGPRNVRHVRSATTLADFAVSLCRCGDAERVPAGVVVSVLNALEARLPHSRSLFVDLSHLTWSWPLVSLYPRLCMNPLVAIANSGGSSENADSGATAADVQATFDALYSTARALVKSRVEDIARSPQLRPNTFLFGQLSSAVRFAAMPKRGSDEEAKLVANLPLWQLVQLLSNPRSIIDVATLALHLLPFHASQAENMIGFVRKNVGALRVQDHLILWWIVSEQLRESGNSSSSGGGGADISSKALGLLHDIKEVTSGHVMQEKNVSKLSSTEHKLMSFLQ